MSPCLEALQEMTVCKGMHHICQAEEEHFARQQQSQQVTKANKSFQKILEQHLHQVLEVTSLLKKVTLVHVANQLRSFQSSSRLEACMQ